MEINKNTKLAIEDNGELDFNADEGTIQDPVGLGTQVTDQSSSASSNSPGLAGTGQSAVIYATSASLLMLLSITLIGLHKRALLKVY